MEIFFNLVTNLIPLYLLILCGFLIGRYAQIDRQTLINLVLYLCLPVVIFGFVAHLDLKPAYALLPVIAFVTQTILCIVMYNIGRGIYGDARANLLAMCTSMGNAGYFGLPLVLLLFDTEYVAIYMFMLLGGTLYEGTIGYYIAARGKFTVKESLIKVLTFPSVYAVTAGLLANLTHLPLPDLFDTYWAYFKGAYVILGMMIIGAALAPVKKLEIVPKFLGLVIFGKFIFWPALALGFVMADRTFLHIFSEPVRQLIVVYSLVPPAANIAAFAEQFGIRPAKAATTILITTILALFSIPATLTLLGMH
jgi:predicted permease